MFGFEGSRGRFVFQNSNSDKVDWHKEVGSAADKKNKEREKFYGEVGEKTQDLKAEIDAQKLQKEYKFKKITGKGKEFYLSVQLAEFFGETVPRDGKGNIKETGWDVAGHKKTFDVLKRITNQYPEYNVDKPNVFEGKKLVIKDNGDIEIVDVEEVVIVEKFDIEASLNDYDLTNIEGCKDAIKFLKGKLEEYKEKPEECDCDALNAKILELEGKIVELENATDNSVEKRQENEQKMLDEIVKNLAVKDKEIHWKWLQHRKRNYTTGKELFHAEGDGVEVIVSDRTFFGSNNGRKREVVLTGEKLKEWNITQAEALDILNKDLQEDEYRNGVALLRDVQKKAKRVGRKAPEGVVPDTDGNIPVEGPPAEVVKVKEPSQAIIDKANKVIKKERKRGKKIDRLRKNLNKTLKKEGLTMTVAELIKSIKDKKAKENRDF